MSINKLVHKKLTELALHQSQQKTQNSVQVNYQHSDGQQSSRDDFITKGEDNADTYSPHAKSGQQTGEFLYPLLNIDLIAKKHPSPVCSYEVSK